MSFGFNSPSSRHSAELDGISILAIEDHADSLELLTAALQVLGATVFPANNSREAFDLLLQHRPHLVVSDIGLPDEDGCSLMRRIRKLGAEQGGNTPAIAVSAFTSPEDRKNAIAAGFQAFVPKPMELSELMRSIRLLVPTPISASRSA